MHLWRLWGRDIKSYATEVLFYAWASSEKAQYYIWLDFQSIKPARIHTHRKPLFTAPSCAILTCNLAAYSPYPLELANSALVPKYEMLREQLSSLRPRGVTFSSCNMSRRGVVCAPSYKALFKALRLLCSFDFMWKRWLFGISIGLSVSGRPHDVDKSWEMQSQASCALIVMFSFL